MSWHVLLHYHTDDEPVFIAVETIAMFDFVMGVIASIGLLYLLYVGTFVVHYRRFFRLILVGLLIYAITGPIIGTFAPAYIHATHGIAALFVSLGLYDLVREDIVGEQDISALVGGELLEDSIDLD